METKRKERLLSVDVVRGMTVAGMILVNNGYKGQYEMLRHAEWNGLSVSDLVFPFFLFIMGVSLYLSMGGRGMRLDAVTGQRVVKRTVLLLLLGLAINWIDRAVGGKGIGIDELRFWGVLQRIAFCYLLAALLLLKCKEKWILPVAIGCLVFHALVVAFGNGYFQDRDYNLIARIDVWLIGRAHMYTKSPVDPEGLEGIIPSLANVLFGLWCGRCLKREHNQEGRVSAVLTCGALLVMAAFLVQFSFPYNKRIWSPSFALMTSGLCSLLLGVVSRYADGSGRGGKLPSWMGWCRTFGVNALALYICSELLSIVFGAVGVNAMLYGFLDILLPWCQVASLIYALLYVVLNYRIGLWLYRRGIFIKL